MIRIKKLLFYCCSFIFIGQLIIPATLVGQSTDSLNQVNPKRQWKDLWKESVVPLSLLGTGLIFNKTAAEKSLTKMVRRRVGPDFYLDWDDYTRYAPIGQLVIGDIVGLKARNHWFDQAKNLTMAIIVTDFITFRLKKLTNKARPNSNSNDGQSFPSGHTSFAFTNAAVLYEEFREHHPIYASSGFAFATTTGALRIANNAHWLSDVLVSAAIGIGVTKLIYHFEPFKKINPFKKKKKIKTLLPQIENGHLGFYLSMRL